MNGDTESPQVRWDSFKAWVRDAYISPIAALQREVSRSLEFLEAEVVEYISSPTSERYRARQRTLSQLSLLCVENTKKALLYSQQRAFEYGDKNGCLLAWLAKRQSPTTHIVSVRDANGHPLLAPDLINNYFMQFFLEIFTRLKLPTHRMI